jgi:hypothetical protein
MDKGIRPAANNKFMEMLPQRAELGNTRFRKEILAWLELEFDCTRAAAATHYNFAFKQCKAAHPELVVGLGRPEGKNNGGRKKKSAVEGAETTTEDGGVVAEVIETAPAVKLFNVYKKKDNSLVLLGVTEAEADAAIEKAAKTKKAALVKA